ncbi:uncharacterized protein LOC114357304 [Ostrinia furnacalis]|uniref:uncharacterized protein LOC114357304 n=1 Tax=Ostrinia furnacalis TaxID=93504 RepID=UPI001040D197|nr:uncharacterized protein LOC114357304 [Ostrinia furnacalis]
MNIGCYLLIASFFHITSALSTIKIKYEDTSAAQDRVVNCAVKIANENFDYRLHTAILYKDVDERFVNNFLKNYQGSVIVDSKRDAAPPKQVVIIVESFHSFAKITSRLKPDLRGKTVMSGGANFIIIVFSSPKRIERITSFLWSYYVINVVVIATDKKNRTALYSYFPFKNHLHCQNTLPTLISYCDDKSLRNDIYPDKMLNMRGCPLYVSTNKLYHPNTEQKIPLQIIKKAIVRLLRDIMNFTPIISTRDYVSIDSDRAKNWSVSLNDLITGVANISLSTIPLGVDRMGFLDYSIPYFRVRLAWLAPPVRPGPVWWRLLFPLNGYLWAFLMSVSFFVKSVPFIWELKPVKRFCRRYFRNFDKLHGVVFRSWGIFMGQPIRMAPKKFRDFYIIALWLWFTFVIRSAYQSVLIVALKTDAMMGNFVNLKEAVDRGYRFGGRGGILTHFERDEMIRDGFEIIPEERFDDVFTEVVEGRSEFVLATSLEYAWAYCMSQGKKEDSCGHILPDSIMTVPLVVWMKSQSPFVRPLSAWLPRLIEAGLLEREVVLKPTFSVVTSSDPSALTQEQTASCLLCLALGTLISGVVFVLELMRYKFIEQRNAKCPSFIK